MTGNLFLIVAPSGAGKSTLVKALLERNLSLQLSISYTTRMPRLSETHGKDYFFIELKEFLRLQSEKKMLESAEVHGNFYGTPRDWVFEQLTSGNDIVLEIDCQGARQVKNIFPYSIEIFILPPSLTILEERLRKRAQDTEKNIVRRLKQAKQEILCAVNANYVIINADFQRAVNDLQSVIISSRLNFLSQSGRNKELFQRLGFPVLKDS